MPKQTLATSLLPDEGYFTGRKSELALLTAHLSENKLVVLEGLAGIGKTALALHYTYQTATDYEAVIWHEVQPGDSVESVLVSIAAWPPVPNWSINPSWTLMVSSLACP